ncbi:MAG: ACP S-malonyltransferase [Bacteroidales bacterium]
MKAYVFPGQGTQFKGMAKDLYESNPSVKALFNKANKILNFDIINIMFNGSAEELKQTKVTQPAIFLHSVASAMVLGDDFKPDMVAGHSLGEFSALVASKAMSFENGLKLVSTRALAMQKACEKEPSTMAAILGLADEVVEDICKKVDGIVIPANYNCPGQLVISGTVEAIDKTCELAKEAGARRSIKLSVGGAFHSPLMESARKELASAIETTEISKPICPIYQNVDGLPHTDPKEIKDNLLMQLTSPVRWTQTVLNMKKDGMTEFVELDPGKVLTGLISKCLK